MLKITLPTSINTIPEAKTFLDMLKNNKLTFHPEDDANHYTFGLLKETNQPTKSKCDQLNKLMDDIYNLEGNNGSHATPNFDPCAYILNSYAIFLMKDLSGRGYSRRIDGNDLIDLFILQADEDTSEEEKQDLESYVVTAEVTDTWQNAQGNISLIRID